MIAHLFLLLVSQNPLWLPETPTSADGFSFAPLAKSFRASTERLESLECDVLLTPHPDASETLSRLGAGAGGRVEGEAGPADAKRARAAGREAREREDGACPHTGRVD
ncbi:MAG: hypothetical protein JNK82_20130 [Myxococcaceae bacterium]|nr:hypothetical protein [Myxococcaceae bacterium]